MEWAHWTLVSVVWDVAFHSFIPNVKRGFKQTTVQAEKWDFSE